MRKGNSAVCSLRSFKHRSQLMRLWYLSHRRPAKAQASLRIHAVSPQPSLFAHMKYGSRRRIRPKIRHLASLDGCTCVFKEWVYGGRKLPWSQELAHLLHAQPLNRTRDMTVCLKLPLVPYMSLVIQKPVFGVCNQGRLQPACTATEAR